VHLHALTCCFLLCKTWKVIFIYFFYFPFVVTAKFVVCIVQGQNPQNTVLLIFQELWAQNGGQDTLLLQILISVGFTEGFLGC